MSRRASQGLGFVAILALVGTGWWFLGYPLPWAVGSPELAAENPSEPSAPKELVELSPERLEATGIVAAPVAQQTLQSLLVVPGKIVYDDEFHVAVKASAAGTLTKVLVKPGDTVKSGDVLAILSSPEIGTARADVLLREQELAQARQEVEWQKQTKAGVTKLLAAIRADQPLDQLDATLRELVLGDSREKLITSYTRYVAARGTWEKTKGLAAGILSERTVQAREREVIAAREALTAICEQSTFDLRQRELLVQRTLDDAQRRREISQQHLATLLGYEEDQTRSGTQGVTISHVEIRAPFAGVIEQRGFAANERVKQGDSLFVLADTQRLWVQADLREADWSALQLVPNTELEVELPALPERKFQARLYFLGREVSPTTLALPLVAKLDNPSGELRPGLFARVSLPLGQPLDCLAVPDSAVTQQAGEQFVFVEETPGKYRRREIQPGISAGGWTQIKEGLRTGERVVSSGVFLLKSELLLEAEAD